MTQPPRSPSDSLVALLQPYIDGELDAHAAAAAEARLDADPELRSIVAEQRAARGLLRELPREAAPGALRARLLLDLDAVDLEQAAALSAPRAPRRARARALLHGALVMTPAAAAAALLFVVLRAPGGEALGAEGVAAPTLAQRSSSAGRDAPPALPPVDGAPRLIGATPGPAPAGVTLVGLGGAAVAPEVEAIEYELDGGRILELRRPALSAAPAGDEIVYRGARYRLHRDPRGRVVVAFNDGAVERALVVASADPRRLAPGSEQRVLLELAHLLRGGGAR